MTAATSLGRLDRCRRPGSSLVAADRALPGAKEWHHVVIHHQGLHLLVNLSELSGRYDHQTARVIVMAYTDSFHSAVEVAAPAAVQMKRSTLDARYGANTRWWWEHDHYRLVVHQPDSAIDIDLRLDPLAEHSMLTGVSLSSHERLSWFFVPRLRARGSVTIGADRHEIRSAPAYHDHNWGRFDWGGDYSWEWISGVSDTWSLTASRLLDGARSTLTSQYMHVEHDGRSETFRDAEISTHAEGRLRVDDVPVVPGAMRLITPSSVEDVPERMHWSARRGANRIEALIAPRRVARLVVPSERAVDEVIVLAEVIGRVEIDAMLGGRHIRDSADVVLELLR